jgi:hypothetical protein
VVGDIVGAKRPPNSVRGRGLPTPVSGGGSGGTENPRGMNTSPGLIRFVHAVTVGVA